jgi:hypothetical protein
LCLLTEIATVSFSTSCWPRGRAQHEYAEEGLSSRPSGGYHCNASPRCSGTPSPNEGIVRYTAEIPKYLHRALKVFAMDHDTSTYAVTKSLLALLAEDQDVRRKVVEVLACE